MKEKLTALVHANALRADPVHESTVLLFANRQPMYHLDLTGDDMSDHDAYRDGNAWLPFWASGDVNGAACAIPLQGEGVMPRRQPTGFRGASPGASVDDRGLPRIRVNALYLREN